MDRPHAIELVRKLRRLGEGNTPEAATARVQAAKHQARHKITEAELVEAKAEQAARESSGGKARAGFDNGVMSDAFLADFAQQMRSTLCSEGRKRGRFADHPDAERILRARANGTTRRVE